MPFCSECAKYWTPSAMEADGSCPRCHRVLEAPSQAIMRSPVSATNLDLRKLATPPGEEEIRAPWHFKLLVVGLVLYLGWRIVDIFI